VRFKRVIMDESSTDRSWDPPPQPEFKRIVFCSGKVCVLLATRCGFKVQLAAAAAARRLCSGQGSMCPRFWQRVVDCSLLLASNRYTASWRPAMRITFRASLELHEQW